MEGLFAFYHSIVAILFTDLLIGVLIGLLSSIVIQFYLSSLDAINIKTYDDKIHIEIHDKASFMNKSRLVEILHSFDEVKDKYIEIDYDGSDADILEIINYQQSILKSKNITVIFNQKKELITN